MLTSETVLVGHSLENDLRALRIVHGRVVDTATIFSHSSGGRAKPGLSWLAYKYLSRRIQHLGACVTSVISVCLSDCGWLSVCLFVMSVSLSVLSVCCLSVCLFFDTSERLKTLSDPRVIITNTFPLHRHVLLAESGHNSSVDAKATLDLFKLKLKQVRGGC